MPPRARRRNGRARPAAEHDPETPLQARRGSAPLILAPSIRLFADRLLATLVHLRHGATHDVLACWFNVGGSAITRTIGEVRPLLAERGRTVSPGLGLRTLAEVVDPPGAGAKSGIVDGTETGLGGQPPGAKTGTHSPPARAGRTRPRPWWSPTRTAGYCSVTRPSSEAA
ncbi:helix-turn-helix domain-containing protein [Streptomyces smyrnaeus]|uniref:helix-turn-helix domain-containing protein n=1 Tax=Streptomyces smyrnaeus TaxID=1387713 RepID=UPI0033F6C409